MSKRILIAEDDRSSLMLLKLMVEAEGGVEVVSAADGEEAWALLMGGGSFDACILDVMMPQMDGLELTKRIRSDPDMKKLPVILCTAQHDRSTVGQAAALSINDYIVKPYSRDRVLKQVRRISEGKAASANIEPFANAARRLGISDRQVTGLLADVVKDSIVLIAALKETSAETAAGFHLVRIGAVKGAAINFGAFGMARALAALEVAFKAAGTGNAGECVKALEVESDRLASALAAANPVPAAAPASVAPAPAPQAAPAPVEAPLAEVAAVEAAPVA
jgi:two-component system chemotaxis response regulator CheY